MQLWVLRKQRWLYIDLVIPVQYNTLYGGLSNYLYVCMSICLVCLYVCMSVCLYDCMSVCLYVCMSVCLYICMSVCLYVCMSVCLYVCMSVCLYVYLPVSPSVFLSFPSYVNVFCINGLMKFYISISFLIVKVILLQTTTKENHYYWQQNDRHLIVFYNCKIWERISLVNGWVKKKTIAIIIKVAKVSYCFWENPFS